VANGVEAIAVLPLGGPDGRLLATLLEDDVIPTRGVPVAAATRSNITLVEVDGTVTKINAPGEHLAHNDLAALLAAVSEELVGAHWMVGCGSLPEGAPIDLYARLVGAGRAAGAMVAIDTSGAALAVAVEAGPDLLKPNLAELRELVGRPLGTLDAVVRAGQELCAQGVGEVLVSLGADGAVLVDADSAHVADAPSVVARSDVGAGDTMLAGFLAAGAAGPAALAASVAWGAAAVQLPGTAVPGPEEIASLLRLVSTRRVDESDAHRPTEPAA
jgi:1-phosphofructokinase